MHLSLSLLPIAYCLLSRVLMRNLNRTAIEIFCDEKNYNPFCQLIYKLYSYWEIGKVTILLIGENLVVIYALLKKKLVKFYLYRQTKLTPLLISYLLISRGSERTKQIIILLASSIQPKLSNSNSSS